MTKLILTIVLMSSTSFAMTPEQERQVARMRLAGACQSLVKDGLVKSCTVKSMGGR